MFSNDFLSAFCLSAPKSIVSVNEEKYVDRNYKGKWVVFKVNHPICGNKHPSPGQDDTVNDSEELRMFVLGSVPRLGSWNIELAAPMTPHKKKSVGSWWDLLFMLPPETFFSYVYVLKDSFGGVVWKSPIVRQFTTKCPVIIDIITLDEFQSAVAMPASGAADNADNARPPHAEAGGASEGRSVAADFVVISSEHAVRRASRRDLRPGRREPGRHPGPSLLTARDSEEPPGLAAPVETVWL